MGNLVSLGTLPMHIIACFNGHLVHAYHSIQYSAIDSSTELPFTNNHFNPIYVLIRTDSDIVPAHI